MIRSIYDGDTLRADVDLGFKVTLSNIALRLNGLNTPELDKIDLRGRIAKEYLASRIPPGTEVKLITVKDKTEKYGRILANIYLQDECINDTMIAKGYASAWNGQGERP